jgi:hypothetical protein
MTAIPILSALTLRAMAEERLVDVEPWASGAGRGPEGRRKFPLFPRTRRTFPAE